MKLDNTLGATLLGPVERVGVVARVRSILRAAGIYRRPIVAVYAAPTALPGWGDVLVTVVLARLPSDRGGLPIQLIGDGDPVRLGRRLSIDFVDVEDHSCSHGLAAAGVLNEYLVVDDRFVKPYSSWIAEKGFNPHAAAVAIEVERFRRGLYLRFPPNGTSGTHHQPRDWRWRYMGEVAVASALLDAANLAARRLSVTAGDIVTECANDLRARDGSSPRGTEGRKLLRWLLLGTEEGLFSQVAVKPSAATVKARRTAAASEESLWDFDPDDARAATIVATGGTRPIQTSLRAKIIQELNPESVVPATAGEEDEYLL